MLSTSQYLWFNAYVYGGIIGKSNIWQFALKMLLVKFYLAFLSTVWKETNAYSLNGIHLIWQYSIYVIRQTVKLKLPQNTYTMYTI